MTNKKTKPKQEVHLEAGEEATLTDERLGVTASLKSSLIRADDLLRLCLGAFQNIKESKNGSRSYI